MVSGYVQIYIDAFNRLKEGKAINIEFKKGQQISNNTVAREAGKAVGSLRRNRGEGYAALCDEIEAYEPPRTSVASRSMSRLENVLAENGLLKEQNSALKSRYQSLLYLNYELTKKLEMEGVKPPAMGVVRNIKTVDDNGLNNDSDF